MARVFGFLLLAMGVVFAWLAGLAFPQAAALPWRSGAVATALAALIVLYNALLKRTLLGPLGMGACRFLNVLLGMSLARAATDTWLLGYGSGELLIAAGIGVYIVGVTWFARQEAEHSRAWQLFAAMLVMVAGVVLLAVSVEHLAAPLFQEPTFFWILLALLMVTVLRRAGTAVLEPSPQRVQMAVKHSILSLIWLDAAIVSATAPLAYALLVAALLVPALFLGWWVYST
jgi:4-hydroxybenzoate polyprenyltransferase